MLLFSGAPNQHVKTLAPTLQIDFISSIVCVILLKILQGGLGNKIFIPAELILCVCVCDCFSLQSLNWRMVGMSILRSPSSIGDAM